MGRSSFRKLTVTDLDGVLVIDKPAGMTSKDVSRHLERRFGRMRLGHVGTLDPLAQGVLPILLGAATRLQDYLLDIPKEYEFDIAFGSETTTLDSAGETLLTAPFDHLSEEIVREMLPRFTGKLTQIPPAYSAVKVAGRPLYKYARSGVEVDRDQLARQIEVYSLRLIKFAGTSAVLRCECSRGTYVRVLAQDISRTLATAGHVSRLVRLRSSGFSRANAVSLENLPETIEELRELVVPVRDLEQLGLPLWQSFQGAWTQRLAQGQRLKVRPDLFARGWTHGERAGSGGSEAMVVLLDEHHQVLGIGKVERDMGGAEELVTVSMKRSLR